MSFKRTVVTMVLILVTTVIVLVNAKDVTTLEYDDFLSLNETNARHRVDTGSSIDNNRQGRASLQIDPPSSKAKREQALRSILAARRRQILSQRATIESRNLNHTPRSIETKDSSGDVLEAQETKHGMYVTASGATSMHAEEEASNGDVDIEFVSKDSQEKQTKRKNENGTKLVSNIDKNHKNSLIPSTTFSSLNSPKSSDTESRRKNIVSMPESLYNYFRPVESNIPVEDMSQFLYFGQKIQAESQNSTGNNSVEATATVPTVSSSRRRYSMKRLGTTSPVPMLEEIINEEMNIAVERQTVEKNKMSKVKNAFRSPENGVHYRKIRPTEAMIITGGNLSEIDDKFHETNLSAHAVTAKLGERGSTAAHVVAETRNATNSTQILNQQPVSANEYELSGTESEIALRNRTWDRSNEPNSPLAIFNVLEQGKTSKSSPRSWNTNSSALDDTKSHTTVIKEKSSSLTDMEMYGAQTEKKIRRIDVPEISDKLHESIKSEEMQAYQTRTGVPGGSNNIETSTSRDKLNRPTAEPFGIVWTSPETSTLRIIVTEGTFDDSFVIGADIAEKYTVKSFDSTDEVSTTPSFAPSLPVPSKTLHGEEEQQVLSDRNKVEPDGNQDRRRQQQRKQRGPEDRNKVEQDGNQDQQRSADRNKVEHNGNRDRQREQQQGRTDRNKVDQNGYQDRHRQQQANLTDRNKVETDGNRDRHRQQQQQHVYAYTITNVTRLLRNYTGPGLSKEEEGGPGRSEGTTEITSGSAQRRQPPPPTSLLLPRAGSGIEEAARAPEKTSAGTTVEVVEAAGGASADRHVVGERQRKVVTAAPPQSQQRAVNGTTSVQLTSVNKSGPRSVKTAEVNSTGRGAVRWNHTKVRNTDLEGVGDRRFLRKSASAVLNQRIGAGPEDEGTGVVIGKRRRLSNGQSGSGVHRRGKGTNKTVEAIEKSTVNVSGLIGDKKNSYDIKNVGNIEKLSGNRTFDDIVAENRTTETIDMYTKVVSSTTTIVSFASSVEDTIETTTPQMSVNQTVEDEIDMTEAVTLMSENTENDTKDENAGLRSENESVTVNGMDGGGSPTVTVTATLDETIAPRETTTTPLPAPVFPVTPRMITETIRASIDKDTFTVKPTESVSQVVDSKTKEANKTIGTVNLDPSEIQKMYRSRDGKTTTMEVPTSTMTTVRTETSSVPRNENTTIIVKPTETTTNRTILDPRKRGTVGERSPEVRGRNLSDKSQDTSSDKDDILPIMHLYNTSDIFNDSNPVNSFSRGTERRVELPVSSRQPEISRTTEKSNQTKNPIHETIRHSTRSPEITRKDKQEDNRETTTPIVPTGPGRGSSSNGNGGNRTRHRPIYHPTILPEYNTTVYPNELNRTLFETGLISVSPRESVNISEVISKRHDGDAIASQETVAVVSYILATLVVFPIAVGVGLILRRLILRNRKVLEESDTSSEISCRKDALNLENGDFKTSIEKAITKLPRIQHLCHEAEKPPPPSQESRWEFPRDKLRLQTVLGQGNFGQVWKAEADDLTGHQGQTRLVAVKTVKEGASEREKEDLVRELEIMQQLGSHPNVVTLLGCCTEQEPHYLILEYVMYGKLLAYLRDHRTRQDFYNFSEDSAALTSRDLTVFGYCVARGMEYLASKKIIHRDLAARNVLVDHNKLCKIADFGMSRFANEDGEVIETRHGRNALPIRWMAPESLIYSLFTTKTDVWSYGILMWEIVTLGSTPYPDMTAREVMRNVQNGYRLERPSHCRSELFRVISRCWHADPDRRPEFQTLRRDLAQLLEDNMNGHYVDLESFASECTD